MKEIQLTQGRVALVDDDLYDELNKFKWCADKEGKTFYAIRAIKIDGKKTTQRMHCVIMNAKGVDHRDGNGCNNTRENLRVCTQSENLMNTRKRENTSSIYKGVYFHKLAGKWQARIAISGKRIELGLFELEADAARAYNARAIELFGEFCSLNKFD